MIGVAWCSMAAAGAYITLLRLSSRFGTRGRIALILIPPVLVIYDLGTWIFGVFFSAYSSESSKFNFLHVLLEGGFWRGPFSRLMWAMGVPNLEWFNKSGGGSPYLGCFPSSDMLLPFALRIPGEISGVLFLSSASLAAVAFGVRRFSGRAA